MGRSARLGAIGCYESLVGIGRCRDGSDSCGTTALRIDLWGTSPGLVLALCFNAAGVALALGIIPGGGIGSAGGLVLFSEVVTLWSFLGLLTLPTLSRRAVYALDRQVADLVDNPMAVARLIAQLDRDQEDERDRGRVTETIFHPVPAPAQRALALNDAGRARTRFIPWRVARMSLFTSWASLSLLSRAVHCNIGRPDLWVMYQAIKHTPKRSDPVPRGVSRGRFTVTTMPQRRRARLLDDAECLFMRGGQHRRGRRSSLVRLQPSRSTQTPLVSRLQSWKLGPGTRGGGIVALGLGVGEKGIRHRCATTCTPRSRASVRQ